MHPNLPVTARQVPLCPAGDLECLCCFPSCQCHGDPPQLQKGLLESFCITVALLPAPGTGRGWRELPELLVDVSLLVYLYQLGFQFAEKMYLSSTYNHIFCWSLQMSPRNLIRELRAECLLSKTHYGYLWALPFAQCLNYASAISDYICIFNPWQHISRSDLD